MNFVQFFVRKCIFMQKNAVLLHKNTKISLKLNLRGKDASNARGNN